MLVIILWNTDFIFLWIFLAQICREKGEILVMKNIRFSSARFVISSNAHFSLWKVVSTVSTISPSMYAHTLNTRTYTCSLTTGLHWCPSLISFSGNLCVFFCESVALYFHRLYFVALLLAVRFFFFKFSAIQEKNKTGFAGTCSFPRTISFLSSRCIWFVIAGWNRFSPWTRHYSHRLTEAIISLFLGFFWIVIPLFRKYSNLKISALYSHYLRWKILDLSWVSKIWNTWKS